MYCTHKCMYVGMFCTHYAHQLQMVPAIKLRKYNIGTLGTICNYLCR